MSETGVKEKPRNDEYYWQKQRLKPDAERMPGAGMFSGFGPEGRHSLYLPVSRKTRAMKIVNGKPQLVFSGGSDLTPEIHELRKRIIATGEEKLSDAGQQYRRIMFPDLVLAEYLVELLATQYNLSDEDLQFLMSGTKWPEVVVIHAMGGEKGVQAVADLDVGGVVESVQALERRIRVEELNEETGEANEVDASPDFIAELTEAVNARQFVYSDSQLDLSMD